MQSSQINAQSIKTRQAGQVNVPALAANIFAAATNRTYINNKRGCLLLISLVKEMSLFQLDKYQIKIISNCDK
jgi:hypothetical protein